MFKYKVFYFILISINVFVWILYFQKSIFIIFSLQCQVPFQKSRCDKQRTIQQFLLSLISTNMTMLSQIFYHFIFLSKVMFQKNYFTVWTIPITINSCLQKNHMFPIVQNQRINSFIQQA